MTRRGLFAVLLVGASVGCSADSVVPTSRAITPFDSYRGQATEQQLPYFADGVVEFSEYEAAVLATVACVRSQGLIGRAELAGDGFYQYGFLSASGLGEALDTCRETWSQQVELAYQESQGPTPAEQPAVGRTLRCLVRAGSPATGGYRPDQLRAFIDGLPDGAQGRACAGLLPPP